MWVVIIKTERGIYFLYPGGRLGALRKDAEWFNSKSAAELAVPIQYDNYIIEEL